MNEARYEAEAGVFQVFGHPVRLKLLDFLAKGSRCVCEIEPVFDLDQSTISRHLIVLKKAGLVSARKEGVKVIYEIKDGRIREIRELVKGIMSDQAREAVAVLGRR